MHNQLFHGSTSKDAFWPKSADFGILEKELEDPCEKPMSLPLDFLKYITRNFSEKQVLGRGGFGVVYKGVLRNGKTIAVKKLSGTHLDNGQFEKEITDLIGLKHKNVVQLIGYCIESRSEAVKISERKYVMAEKQHRLICFEYIKNKSLDKYITSESSGLEWHIRFKIIKGICCGLHYLHKEWRIVHLDLKPQNILMDGNMVPKIADFGMSRLFGQEQSRIITENRGGTLGYMAPEYLNNGLISTKSDIFSLGVIIIELLIGSRDYPDSSQASFEQFTENVVKRWRNRFEETSVPLEIYREQVKACIKIGMNCVEPDPEKRPAAWDIIEMLNTTEGDENRCSGVNGGGPHADEARLVSRRKARVRPFVAELTWLGQTRSVLPYKTATFSDLYRISNKLRYSDDLWYHCVRLADGTKFAYKYILKSRLLCREDYDDLGREIQIMHHLSDYPDVVRICNTYEEGSFVQIVTEPCASGDLMGRIGAKGGHYGEGAVAKIIRTIVEFIAWSHSFGVMHRYLAPENFLFANTAEDAPPMATDFRFSVFYKPGDKFSDALPQRKDRFSSDDEIPYYVAPEVLQKCYGPEADVWSAGVILYVLLCGEHPFWAETKEDTYMEILQGELDLESTPWPRISDSAKDLVRNMLTRDPKKRFSTHQILCHPWLNDGVTTPDKPMDSAVLSRLKHFLAMSVLKKMAVRVIAERMLEEEIEGLKHLFKMFDTDNSGTITFNELKDGLERLGSASSEDEIQTLMDGADMDRNGTIDCAEFVAATLHVNKVEREENLLCAFSFFDKDGDGYITTGELSQACREFGFDDVDHKDMIKDIDQDDDGQIDYVEFVTMMRKDNAREP